MAVVERGQRTQQGRGRARRATTPLAAACALLALAGAARAEDTPPVRGDGALIPPPVEARQLEPTPAPAPHRVDLFESVRLQPPSWRSLGLQSDFLGQISFEYTPWIPGSVQVEYAGVEGYIVRQLESRLSSEWRRNVRAQERWDTDPYAPDLVHRMNVLALAYDDQEHRYGSWAERTWFQSLPAHKGGAPEEAFTHQVGTTVEWIKWGPFSFNNAMRGRLAKIALFELDAGVVLRDGVPEQPVRARDFARLDRGARLDGDPEVQLEEQPGQVRPATPTPSARIELTPRSDTFLLTLEPEAKGRLMDGLHWRVKVRPRTSISFSDFSPGGSLGMRVICEILLGSSRERVAEIEANVRIDPFEGEAQASLEFALLTW